jgi:serine/threonine protein kinase
MKRAMQGTLEYMAPEVLLKKPASPASDVYALAIAINELATGKTNTNTRQYPLGCRAHSCRMQLADVAHAAATFLSTVVLRTPVLYCHGVFMAPV